MNKDKIISLIKSEKTETIQVAAQLCIGQGFDNLLDICNFLLDESNDIDSCFHRAIKKFLLQYLDDYPSNLLDFHWYDSSMINSPFIGS